MNGRIVVSGSGRVKGWNIFEARIMRFGGRHNNGPNGVRPRVSSNASQSPPPSRRTLGFEPTLVPPNTNGDTGLQVEFFQDVLDVFLNGARAASENFADLPIAFAGRDPVDHFELALG